MSDHPPTNEDDPKPSDAVSEGQNPDASTDEVKALKSEMIQHRQEAARLKEENKVLTAQSEKLDSKPPQAPQGDQFADRLDRIERQGQLQKLMAEDAMTAKQADAVVTLMKEIPSLDAGEAKLLAAQRDKELFSDTAASSGFDQSIHGTSRPTAGTAPVEQQTSDTEDRMAYIATIRGNKKKFEKYLNNHTGAIAAQQVGKPGHKLHPIPQK
tara:strand:- start:24147 stop:24782 length:636 start_codon:yes stop_codon:yes gene_type:complete